MSDPLEEQLKDFGSRLNRIVGPVLASNTTAIAPTFRCHHVSGTAAIPTITPPYPGFTGYITLIPDAIFTLTAADNIGLAATAVVSKAMHLFYDGKKWYPSY